MTVIRIEDYGDGIQAVVFDRPNSSHNFMNLEVVAELHGAVRSLSADDAVRGIVITSAKKSFVVGGDLKELKALNTPEEATRGIKIVQSCLRDLELAPKPVVAAINGLALGGGLEIALACTYRIAVNDPRLKLGLPEVSLGLIPGAGGTQRLPRLIGLAAALPILVEDRHVTGRRALEIGLVDEMVSVRELKSRAKDAILSNLALPDQPWERVDFVIPGASLTSAEGQEILAGYWANVRRRKPGLEPAPDAILTAVETGLTLPIEAGLAVEQEKFATVAASKVVKNKIRTLFLGLNDANGMKDRPKDIAPYDLNSVAVVGVGQMGGGIAYCAAQAGYDVFLLEADKDRLEAGLRSISKRIQGAVERERILDKAAKKMLACLKPTTSYNDISGVDMVFEAVSEFQKIKNQVTAAVCAVVRPDVPIASNTSTIPISKLAGGAGNPERFIGLHFFAPVDRMKLVEVIKGKQTNAATLACALDAVAGMRKTPIVVNDGLGFYTSRVVGAYTGEAFTLLAEGVSPDLIDEIAFKAGMPIGPLAMADITSLTLLKDIVASISGDGTAIGLQGLRLTEALERLTSAGRTGRAGGGGVFDYDEAGQHPWSGLSDCFPASGVLADDEAIEKRLLYSQSLEAVRAIEEGVIESPMDADIGSILGWAFPSAYGGVIGLIDTIGTTQFVAECDILRDQYGGRYEAPGRLRDMAGRGAAFYSE
ncbi:MAG: 3-hydroxyacyl-CoA dehydrogenase NAD-binding domain-containing protein [Rhodospirillales bacterium]|nr:3-hydroxyacyl-CoA dehydrogenase NAD-binding domain-containing protein [Rhodospirillales bacterium]